MTDVDSNALLNAVIPFAQEMLAKRGAFLPFAATVSNAGAIDLMAGMPDIEGDEAIIEFIVSALKQQAAEGQIRGLALCYDARVTAPGMKSRQEAICVELEHAAERCARLFLPYSKGVLGHLSYGQLFGAVHAPRIFSGVRENTR